MIELLKQLCALRGISGREEQVRDFISAHAVKYADKMETDPMGNLMCFRKGEDSSKTLMVCAHMDEVGLIVTGITEDGYLKFDFVGGIDRRVIIGKRVWVGDKAVPGIIGMKAFHLVTEAERKKVPEVSALYIDIGCDSREEAEELVALGDPATFDADVAEVGHLLKAKAIDDRLGCAVIMKLMETKPPVDTWFVFTTQEEVGTRGVATAAFRIRPDAGLIVEGTTAADLPGVPEHKTICKPGNGAVMPFMDRSSIYSRELRQMMMNAADERGIAHQTKQMIAGGTDAGTLQRSCCGVPVLGIAAALRNIHSPASVANVEDCKRVYRLAELFMTEYAKGEY